MTLLKCATHTVRDVQSAAERYEAWFDYSVIEQGSVPEDLAISWGAPKSAGRSYVVMQPASGEQVFLRFVEGDVVPEYAPIRTYGWAAIELCVQDVEAVNERMLRSPFEVIGPPKPLDGFPTVKPMQVRGPDLETVYLTEIQADGAKNGLPSPASLIDRPFILVLACRDLSKTLSWVETLFGFEITAPALIRYSMISLAFDLPEDSKHELVTAKWNGEVFLELDRYPIGATERPSHPGALPPGVSICTLEYPSFERLDGHWMSLPVVRTGPLYGGRRTGVLKSPDGAIFEVIERAT